LGRRALGWARPTRCGAADRSELKRHFGPIVKQPWPARRGAYQNPAQRGISATPIPQISAGTEKTIRAIRLDRPADRAGPDGARRVGYDRSIEAGRKSSA
jgi:hypothetical protein